MTEPDTPPNSDRQDAARRALVQAVHLHAAVRTVREDYSVGSDEWRTATPLVRALDGAIRRQIETARTAGIGPTELVHIVGTSRHRIARIVFKERALLAAAEAEHRDATAQQARDAAVAELRAADADHAAVRATPPSEKRADPVRYNIRRRAARLRLCRALVAAHAEGLTPTELAAETDLHTRSIRRLPTAEY